MYETETPKAHERRLTRERVRLHRLRKREEGEATTTREATEKDRERQYKQLIQQHGEDAAANWKLVNMCGIAAYRMLDLGVTEETASEWQDLIDFVGYLDGEHYHDDPELPRTRWQEYLEFAHDAYRLGFEFRPKPKRVREFFLDWYNSSRWNHGLPILVAGETRANDFRREWKIAPEDQQKEPMLISPAAASFTKPLYLSELISQKPTLVVEAPIQPSVAEILAPTTPEPSPPRCIHNFAVGSVVTKRGGAGTIFKITGFENESHAVCDFLDESNGEVVTGLVLPLSSLSRVTQGGKDDGI